MTEKYYKSLFKFGKICFDTIYYLLFILSIVVLIFFTIKIFNPDTEILDFSFHKEVKLSEFISNHNFDFDVPAILGLEIGDIKATTKFNINDRQSIFLALISFIYAMGLVVFIFYNFHRIFSNFIKSEIFTIKNSRHISYIGISIVLSEMITFILSFIFELYEISIKFFSATITASYNSSLFMVLIGFGLIILGEVFRYGVTLENEQKLTI